jgi:hypothetical protein
MDQVRPVTGHGSDIADYQGREKHSPISDVERDEEEQYPGTDAGAGGKEQPLGMIVDDIEKDDTGDVAGPSVKPKRKRGVPKAKRWSHIKVKGPSKIKSPNSKLLECLLLNLQDKWVLQQSGGLQRSSCSLASRQRLPLTGEFASLGEDRYPEIYTMYQTNDDHAFCLSLMMKQR